MDMTWASIVVWCLVAGPGIGFALGYWYRGRRDRAKRRRMSQRRVLRRREVRRQQAEAETLRISTKQRQLHDNGRKIPAREDAGPPIRIRRINVSRSSRPQH